jgi:lipoate-protein ligase A
MVSSINLLQHMPVDRLFYVSPSANSNSGALSKLSKILQKEDMYSDINRIELLDDIVKKIEQERDDLEEYHLKLKKWEKAHTNIKSETPLFQLQDDDLMTFSDDF